LAVPGFSGHGQKGLAPVAVTDAKELTATAGLKLPRLRGDLGPSGFNNLDIRLDLGLSVIVAGIGMSQRSNRQNQKQSAGGYRGRLQYSHWLSSISY
jgi:hypothetical protein